MIPVGYIEDTDAISDAEDIIIERLNRVRIRKKSSNRGNYSHAVDWINKNKLIDSDIDNIAQPQTVRHRDLQKTAKRAPNSFILNKKTVRPAPKDLLSIETAKHYRTDLAPVIRPVSVNKRFIDHSEKPLSRRCPSEKKPTTADNSTLEDDQKKGLHWRSFRLKGEQKQKLCQAQHHVLSIHQENKPEQRTIRQRFVHQGRRAYGS